MARLIVDVNAKNINSTKKQVIELDKATEKLRLENIKLNKELKSLDKTTEDYTKEEKRLTNALIDNTAKMKANGREQSKLNQSVKKMTSNTDKLKNSLLGLAGVYLSFQGARELTSSFIRTADSVSLMDSKISLSTASLKEFNKAQEELFKISQKTRTGLLDNAELYQRITLSTKELGLSQKEVIRLTESINKSLIVSGTSAEGASTLITQLGQAFSSNFQAVSQELNTLKDQAPSLYQTLLAGLGKTGAEFKKMAEEGQLSSRLIIEAIQKQEKATDTDFAKMAKTVDQSQTQISNSLIVLTGNLDKTFGVTKAISGAFTDLSKSIDSISQDDIEDYADLGRNIVALGAGIGGAIIAFKSFNKVMSISRALSLTYAGSLNTVNARLTTSIALSRALSVTMRAIPFVAVAGAISLFAESLLTSSNNASSLETALSGTSDELKKLTKNQLEYTKVLLERELIETRLARANAIADASSQGLFESDEEHKKDLAFKDEQIKKFNEQTKKLREIKQLLKDVDKQQEEQEENPPDNIKTSLKNLASYYEDIGNFQEAWALKETQIREDLKGQEVSFIEEVLRVRKKKYFDKLEELTIDSIESEYDLREKREKELADARAKALKKEEKDRKKEKDFQKKQIKNNKQLISGYGTLAGAIGDLFNEGSREAEAFSVVQKGLATVNAVNAVLTQGQGDPYSAFGRMATMAVTVGALLSNIGQSISTSNTTSSVSRDAISAQSENTGAGTTLGDAEAISRSISKSLDILEDFAKPEFDLLSSMNKSLISIDQKMGGVAGLLIRQGGFQFGAGFTGRSSSGQNLSVGSANIGGSNFSGSGGLLSAINTVGAGIIPIGDILEKALFGNTVSNVIAGIENKILGGLFGRTSSESTLADSGILFGEQLLSQALDDFQGKAFQTIKTTVTKKSWFSKSSSTSFTTSLQDLNEETERQFGLVLNSLFDTVVKAGEALGATEAQIEQDLSDFYVNIGKISLKGKTGDQIQEALSSVFGKVGDELAREAFPIVENFQSVGEGLFETLTRVATGMQEAEFFTDRLGVSFERIAFSEILNTRGDVGFEALSQSILKADSALFGLNNGVVQLLENFTGTTSELFATYTQLQDVRTQFRFLGNDLGGITDNLVRGAGSTDTLNASLDKFISNFFTKEEQLELNLSRLDREFAKLNLSVPNSKDEFKELIQNVDLTTEAGQELYGRLLLLADTFSDVAKEADGAIDKLSRKLKPFFNTLTETLSSAFDSVINLSNKAQTALSSLSSGQDSEFQTLVNFNRLVSEFNQSKQSTDFARTEGLYNQIVGIATNLGGNQTYTEAIRGFLSGNIQDFNAEKDILRVNIVDGLQELLGLNQEQTSSLKQSVSDGQITNQELSNIEGLTQVQKDGIIETANNSSLFSTEKTLSSLEELSKIQLEDIRKAREEETEALSSKTFQFGDTIGAREQKDIGAVLGTQFENVAPFIESLQGLEVSQDRTADLKNILGFTGTGISESVFSNIQKLSPFIGGIASEAQNIKTEAQANKLDEDIARASEVYNTEYAESESAFKAYNTRFNRASVSKRSNYKETGEDIESGTPYSRTGFSIEWNDEANRTKFVNSYSNYLSQFKEASEAYKVLNNLRDLRGYSSGGFTGSGGKNDIAGVVHKNEYVVDSQRLRNVGGASGMESMLKSGNQMTQRTQQQLLEMNRALLKQVTDLKDLFNNVTKGGNIMSVSLDA